MNENSKEFFEKIQKFLPSTREEYLKSLKEYGEVLETVVIEDIFMPKILEIAKQYMGPKTTLLQMKVDRELGRN